MTSVDIDSRSLERQLLDLILEAMFKIESDGKIHKFLFGKPGVPLHRRNFSTEVHYSRRGLQKAAIFARENCPDYISALPLGQIEDRLSRFISENYWYLMNDVFLQNFSSSYLQIVSDGAKVSLASALKESDLFNAKERLTIYPIVTVRIESDFDGGVFCLVAPQSLLGKIPIGLPSTWVIPTQFPPFSDHQGIKGTPASWLGTRTKTSFASQKIKAAVLGALALLPHRYERYTFTGRKVFGGMAEFLDDGYSMSFGAPVTPPLSEDIILREGDKLWLQELAVKLNSVRKIDRKHIKALEYYYRAWPLSSVARFPIFFMALDAIFGDAAQATQSIVSAVGPNMGPDYDYARLRSMLGLRASVMHGGAPDVVESDKYHKYYVDYGQDPITDLEYITAVCLRHEIFGGLLVERPHTYADLVESKTGKSV